MVLGSCELADLVKLDPEISKYVQEMIGAISTDQNNQNKIIKEFDGFIVCESQHQGALLEYLADRKKGKTHLSKLSLKLLDSLDLCSLKSPTLRN